MVGFLRPLATTSGWTTVPTCYCNSEIQDGVQDGRHNLILPYYRRLLLYVHVQYIVSMGFEVGESIYDGFTVKACLSVTCRVPRRVEALSADQLAHDVSLPTLPSRLLLVV